MSLQSNLFIEKNKIDEFSAMKVTKTGLKTILKNSMNLNLFKLCLLNLG